MCGAWHRRPTALARKSPAEGPRRVRAGPVPNGRVRTPDRRHVRNGLRAAGEEALERLQELFAAERHALPGRALGTRAHAVVLERRVRSLERVAELEALPHVVVAARLVRRAVLRVHGPAHRPQRPGASLDPDHDPLGRTRVVASVDDPLGEAPGRLLGLHEPDYTIASWPA